MPASILLIDDDPQSIRHLAQALMAPPDSFEVTSVDTAGDALRHLASHVVSCVLLDYRLPDATAPEVLRRLRAHEWPEVPVLVLSQAYWPEDEAAALDAGATRFLAKPSDPDALHDVVVGFWHDAGGV